jgi:hypothetical protein
MKKNNLIFISALSLMLAVAVAACKPSAPPSSIEKAPASLSISREEVLDFIRSWGEGLVAIAQAHAEGKEVKLLAEAFIDKMYDYQHPPVLFKPTLAHGEQTFRLTRRGAIAYFVGGDPDYPHDTGFAIKPWKDARFELARDASGIEGWQEHNGLATVMGQLTLTDADGQNVTVNKGWVLKKGTDGKLRIVLHMSALPYVP